MYVIVTHYIYGNMNLRRLRKTVRDREAWCAGSRRVGHDLVTDQQYITDSGHEFEQTLGDSEGQGSLVCCSPWGLRESDTTKQLNNNKNMTTNSKPHCGSGSVPTGRKVSIIPLVCENKMVKLRVIGV